MPLSTLTSCITHNRIRALTRCALFIAPLPLCAAAHALYRIPRGSRCRPALHCHTYAATTHDCMHAFYRRRSLALRLPNTASPPTRRTRVHKDAEPGLRGTGAASTLWFDGACNLPTSMARAALALNAGALLHSSSIIAKERMDGAAGSAVGARSAHSWHNAPLKIAPHYKQRFIL